MNYRWTIQQTADEKEFLDITSTLQLSPVIAQILLSRDIRTPEEIRSYLHPALEGLLDPFLMSGMKDAVTRIEQAIATGEVIWIYGDYDVDGTVSTALLYSFLSSLGATVKYYVSDRFSEGYGVTDCVVDKARADKADLIISVDSGITAVEAITYARSLGMDFIICDHHEQAEELPPATAILDPTLESCTYPFKGLCAGGVTFKLIQALCQVRGIQEQAYQYLDYVALASLADMVPLLGENRILVKFGLEQLRRDTRPGIRGLLQCIGILQKQITASTVVYNIAPRLNAAGRIGDATNAVKLLLSTDDLEAFLIAQDLESKNYQRRMLDERTFIEAQEMADELLKSKKYRSLVLYKPDWHVGVINIVASRLVEKYYLPTVLLTSIEGTTKGSARSIKNFDIHFALKQCQHLLKQFGGHKYASGLSLDEADVPAFREMFDGIVHSIIKDDAIFTPEHIVDAEITFSDLSPKFFEQLKGFAPFGYMNSKPTFITHRVIAASRAKIVGKNHLRLRLRQGHFILDSIGFNLGDKLDIALAGKPLSIVYTIEETVYQKRKSLQLFIKDIQKTSDFLRQEPQDQNFAIV